MAHAVVIMGVSGCGKSTVATGVAGQLCWRAVDADELHTPEAVAKMRSGQALTDDDRAPWLDRVGRELAAACAAQSGVVVACSALRRTYRDRLRMACPGVRFLFLDGDPATIAARMAKRRDHYMPTSLLDSQFRTLERPGPDETDVTQLHIDQPLDKLVKQACTTLCPADMSSHLLPKESST